MTSGNVRRVSTKTFPRQRLRARAQARASPNGKMQAVLRAQTASVKRIIFHSSRPKKLTVWCQNRGVGKPGRLLQFLETLEGAALLLDPDSRPKLLPGKQFSARVRQESRVQS